MLKNTEIASQLAKNIAGAWKIANDEGLSEKGAKEVIKATIEPMKILSELTEKYLAGIGYSEKETLSRLNNCNNTTENRS
jgi:F0F1-type ATP synthase assembly protein I